MSRLKAISVKSPRAVNYRESAPAERAIIAKVVSELDLPLPHSLAQLFGETAESYEFMWALKTPHLLCQSEPIFLGNMRWDLNELPKLDREKKEMESGTVFESQWKDKIAFSNVGDGFLAASTKRTDEIFLLLPDDPPDCLHTFGCGLFEFLLDWSEIAGVAECSLLRFCNRRTGRIDKRNDFTSTWLNWLDVKWGEHD